MLPDLGRGEIFPIRPACQGLKSGSFCIPGRYAASPFPTCFPPNFWSISRKYFHLHTHFYWSFFLSVSPLPLLITLRKRMWHGQGLQLEGKIPSPLPQKTSLLPLRTWKYLQEKEISGSKFSGSNWVSLAWHGFVWKEALSTYVTIWKATMWIPSICWQFVGSSLHWVGINFQHDLVHSGNHYHHTVNTFTQKRLPWLFRLPFLFNWPTNWASKVSSLFSFQAT